MSPDEDHWSTLRRWFPEFHEEVWEKLRAYAALLREWNQKINLVSRKDIDRLETKHLAHCLTITKFLRLMPKARLLDAGTGGGLPGIPLAICYPQAQFTLLDSTAKKIVAVENMIEEIGLGNAETRCNRVEKLPSRKSYDFVIGRGVSSLQNFFKWTSDKIAKGERHSPANGILYLKGGDYNEELKSSGLHPKTTWNLSELLPEAGLDEKYLIHFKV